MITCIDPAGIIVLDGNPQEQQIFVRVEGSIEVHMSKNHPVHDVFFTDSQCRDDRIRTCDVLTPSHSSRLRSMRE